MFKLINCDKLFFEYILFKECSNFKFFLLLFGEESFKKINFLFGGVLLKNKSFLKFLFFVGLNQTDNIF